METGLGRLTDDILWTLQYIRQYLTDAWILSAERKIGRLGQRQK